MQAKKPHSMNHIVIENPWLPLREMTAARIAIGRSGTSLPTQELLTFQLDHAQANDAVHSQLDSVLLSRKLSNNRKIDALFSEQIFLLDSQAQDRMTYLQRPDLGKQLSPPAYQRLAQYSQQVSSRINLAVVIADGLSATAIAEHATPFLQRLSHELHKDPIFNWACAPLNIVRQGRVAVGDDVCDALQADIVLVLIGERPGLSSPDSMGLYLTWQAKSGTTDAQRNCISNIRPQGLSYSDACHKALYLLRQLRRQQQSGVEVKDNSVLSEQAGQKTLNDKRTFCLIKTKSSNTLSTHDN
ncbi:ethanolamine ammonia-lyase subunit EutC [Vibrio sagamiensis]|uniref:Ethanolamine ammonia-lyase small subunit n=1 Tax=Vibrio sagamiensis NBRC 104589 TaxID=1219064 RepID=A0A511QF25_9VIBR|nr:ethanolamine ammonia-lyase subunit EutC [Vibrio sagamiensis]PNQ69814.1 ethanolamine ammonia-lyase subunit EutC [Vibrio agarivorans]GEM75905.1 ethanolamine ammonia-lyase light chain [Vibrio sagamiensis NBRC 104589]